MKYSTRLADTLHILCLIALHEDKLSLSSQGIADSVCTNPSYVRQLMGLLRKAEIVHSVKGHPRPRLARSAAFITLFDVYRAIEGEKPLLHQDIHTNPNCGVGVNIQYVVGDCYQKIQQKAEQEMQNISLADILMQYEKRLEYIHNLA